MSYQKLIRTAYYLRVSTEAQELENQRREILPFIDRRGWKLVHQVSDWGSGVAIKMGRRQGATKEHI